MIRGEERRREERRGEERRGEERRGEERRGEERGEGGQETNRPATMLRVCSGGMLLPHDDHHE